MGARRWLVAATIALVVIAMAVVAVTGRGDGVGDRSPPATTVIGTEVVDDFLADVETSLTASFVIRSTFERRRGEDLVAGEDVTVVQRPPDRLTERADSVSGWLDGRTVTCTGLREDPECLVAGEAVDVERELEEQVATVSGYVGGDEPLYGVAATEPPEVTRVGGEDDRCYTLELLRQLPVAPYGTLARFCFDPETGAPTLLRVERPEAVDVTRAVDLSAQVTDEDLQLPS